MQNMNNVPGIWYTNVMYVFPSREPTNMPWCNQHELTWEHTLTKNVWWKWSFKCFYIFILSEVRKYYEKLFLHKM